MTTRASQNIRKGDLVCFVASHVTAYKYRNSNRPYGREDLFRYRFIDNNIILTLGVVLELHPPETKSSIVFIGHSYHSVLINESVYYVKENDLKVVEYCVES